MLTYLIQTIACSGILYGYYHFFLRNERFHQYNRFYLLAAMFISPILPLFKIPLTISKEEQSPVYAFISTGENIVVTANKGFDFFPFINLLYAIIVAILVSRLIIGILKIVRIKKEAVTEKMEDISFIKTTDPDAPFSFFKWLFWQKNTRLHTPEGAHIFRHEMYHIRSKHTWDLLFIEMLLCVFWFNPFFYLYRKEIKTIQEFLADKHATKGIDAHHYAELLLMQAIGLQKQTLINPFFHNQLKRRIAMLTTSKKPQHQWLRKLLVLPISAVVIALFAFTYNKVETYKTKEKPLANVESLNELKTNLKLDDATLNNLSHPQTDTVPKQKNVEKEPEIFTKVEKEAQYLGDWRNFLIKNLDGSVGIKHKAPPGIYTTTVQFVVSKEGTVSDVKTVGNPVGYGMDEEAVRVVKLSGNWEAAVQNGKKVKAYRKQPISFKITGETKNTTSSNAANEVESVAPASLAKNNVSNNPSVSDDKKIVEKGPEIFTKTEIEASFPGNWRTFLERNLNGQVVVDNGATPGNYTSIIQFVVDVDGNVSDVKALTKNGYGMEEEAIRVIKKSGKWKPAIQNGREVKAYRKQPITFHVNEVGKTS